MSRNNVRGLGMWDVLARLLLALALSCAISGCESTGQQQPEPSTTAVKPPPLAAEVVIYNLEGDLPTEVLEAFTREFGVKVIYERYVDQDEAVANLRAGKIYDVVVLENRLIPQLIQEKLLAELNHGHLLNIKNIAANFRDLAHDPGNRYSVPYNWGTTAMVVRKDLVAQPVTRWTDLWDPRYAGKVGLWMSQRRDILGLALKSLGYSANSENPAELEAALERLQALIPNAVTLEEVNAEDSSEALSSGQVVVAVGYARDVIEGRKKHAEIAYVLPAEGAMLWGDNFVIPASSSRKATAETLINFLLRPEIAAQIASVNKYATANEMALPLLDTELRNDTVVFPSNQDMRQAELQRPLSAEGEKLYADIWERLTGETAKEQ